MTISIVQLALGPDGSGTATNTITVTFGNPLTTGNAVVGGFTFYHTGGSVANVLSISDGTNNYAPGLVDFIGNSDNGNFVTFFLARIVGGPTTITVTLDGSYAYVRALAQELSSGAKIVDVHGGQFQAGTTNPASPVISTNYPNEYVYTALLATLNAVTSLSAQNNFTINNASGSGDNDPLYDASQVLATPGAIQGAFTAADVNDFVVAIIAIATINQWSAAAGFGGGGTLTGKVSSIRLRAVGALAAVGTVNVLGPSLRLPTAGSVSGSVALSSPITGFIYGTNPFAAGGSVALVIGKAQLTVRAFDSARAVMAFAASGPILVFNEVATLAGIVGLAVFGPSLQLAATASLGGSVSFSSQNVALSISVGASSQAATGFVGAPFSVLIEISSAFGAVGGFSGYADIVHLSANTIFVQANVSAGGLLSTVPTFTLGTRGNVGATGTLGALVSLLVPVAAGVAAAGVAVTSSRAVHNWAGSATLYLGPPPGSNAWSGSAALVGTGFARGYAPPNLHLTVNPPNPSIPATTPLGTTVATLTGSWSDGTPFAGNFTFGPPYWDDPPAHVAGAGIGVYAITQPGGPGTVANLIVNPNGAGVGAAGGSIEDVTIVTNDPPVPQVAGFGAVGTYATNEVVVHGTVMPNQWPGSAGFLGLGAGSFYSGQIYSQNPSLLVGGGSVQTVTGRVYGTNPAAFAGLGTTVFNDPELFLTVNPPNPSIPSTTPLGAVVATLTGTWAAGFPFTGNFTFVPPYWDDPPAHVAGVGAGVYAIIQPGGFGTVANLIVNPNGPGVGAAGGTIEDVTIVANDPPVPQVAAHYAIATYVTNEIVQHGSVLANANGTGAHAAATSVLISASGSVRGVGSFVGLVQRWDAIYAVAGGAGNLGATAIVTHNSVNTWFVQASTVAAGSLATVTQVALRAQAVTAATGGLSGIANVAYGRNPATFAKAGGIVAVSTIPGIQYGSASFVATTALGNAPQQIRFVGAANAGRSAAGVNGFTGTYTAAPGSSLLLLAVLTGNAANAVSVAGWLAGAVATNVATGVGPCVSIFWLPNPATGANPIAVTLGAGQTDQIELLVAEYVGTGTASWDAGGLTWDQPGAFWDATYVFDDGNVTGNNAPGGNVPLVLSLTTNAPGDLTVLFAATDPAVTPAASGGDVVRATGVGAAILDGARAIAPAGLTSLATLPSDGQSHLMQAVLVAVAPGGGAIAGAAAIQATNAGLAAGGTLGVRVVQLMATRAGVGATGVVTAATRFSYGTNPANLVGVGTLASVESIVFNEAASFAGVTAVAAATRFSYGTNPATFAGIAALPAPVGSIVFNEAASFAATGVLPAAAGSIVFNEAALFAAAGVLPAAAGSIIFNDAAAFAAAGVFFEQDRFSYGTNPAALVATGLAYTVAYVLGQKNQWQGSAALLGITAFTSQRESLTLQSVVAVAGSGVFFEQDRFSYGTNPAALALAGTFASAAALDLPVAANLVGSAALAPPVATLTLQNAGALTAAGALFEQDRFSYGTNPGSFAAAGLTTTVAYVLGQQNQWQGSAALLGATAFASQRESLVVQTAGSVAGVGTVSGTVALAVAVASAFVTTSALIGSVALDATTAGTFAGGGSIVAVAGGGLAAFGAIAATTRLIAAGPALTLPATAVSTAVAAFVPVITNQAYGNNPAALAGSGFGYFVAYVLGQRNQWQGSAALLGATAFASQRESLLLSIGEPLVAVGSAIATTAQVYGTNPAALAGTGSITATTAVALRATADLMGSGSLVVPAILRFNDVAAFGGAGSFVPIAVLVLNDAAAFAGSIGLGAVVATTAFNEAASFVGSVALGRIIATTAFNETATFAGSAALGRVVASLALNETAALAGNAGMTAAAGSLAIGETAAFVGDADAYVLEYVLNQINAWQGSATLAGGTSLAVSPLAQLQATATGLGGVGGAAATTGFSYGTNPAVVGGVGGHAAFGSVFAAAAADLAAFGTLTGVASALTALAYATFAAAGTVSVTTPAQRMSTGGSLNGAGVVTSEATAYQFNPAIWSGFGAITVVTAGTWQGLAATAAIGGLAAAANEDLAAGGAVAGSGGLVVDPTTIELPVLGTDLAVGRLLTAPGSGYRTTFGFGSARRAA